MYKLNIISKDEYVNSWIAQDRKHLVEIIKSILMKDLSWKNIVKVEIINQLNEEEKIVLNGWKSVQLHQLMLQIEKNI